MRNQDICQLRFSLHRLASISATALLFVVAADSAGQEMNQVPTVVVSVRDSSQAAVPRAYVRLFPSTDRATAATDAGVFSFSARPGKYDLFVEVAGFREVARRIEVAGGEATMVGLTLRVGACPPGPCLTVRPWDPSVVLSISDDESHGITLRVTDLKPLKRQAIVLNDPVTGAQEHYSGFSLAEVLERFCGPRDCAPSLRESPPVYVVASGNGDFIVFPLAKLIAGPSEDKILIADGSGGRPLPNSSLQVFLIENGRIIESVRGVIGIRLVSPH